MSWTGALLALLLLLAGGLVLRALFLTYRLVAGKRARQRDDFARSAGDARALIASPMTAAEKRWSQKDAELALQRRQIDLTLGLASGAAARAPGDAEAIDASRAAPGSIDLTDSAEPVLASPTAKAAKPSGRPGSSAAAAAQAQQRTRAVAAATRRGAAAASLASSRTPSRGSRPSEPGANRGG